jgi:polyisoprenoid-binding protein YceI
MSTITETKSLIPTGTWTVDPVHSKVGFAVKHMGVATVRGEFREFAGTIEVGEDLESSRAFGTVNADSVDTGQAQRDDHLRSNDFFSSEEHPELRFESTRFEQIDDDTLRIVGDLTINGTTREVELEGELVGIGTGASDEQRLGLEVTGQVSRREFGMKFDAALGSGNAVVADKVKLALDLAAVKQG